MFGVVRKTRLSKRETEIASLVYWWSTSQGLLSELHSGLQGMVRFCIPYSSVCCKRYAAIQPALTVTQGLTSSQQGHLFSILYQSCSVDAKK